MKTAKGKDENGIHMRVSEEAGRSTFKYMHHHLPRHVPSVALCWSAFGFRRDPCTCRPKIPPVRFRFKLSMPSAAVEPILDPIPDPQCLSLCSLDSSGLRCGSYFTVFYFYFYLWADQHSKMKKNKNEYDSPSRSITPDCPLSSRRTLPVLHQTRESSSRTSRFPHAPQDVLSPSWHSGMPYVLQKLDAGVRRERCAQKRCDWLDRVGGAVGSSVLNSLSPPPS